jgi:hypothetical protein
MYNKVKHVNDGKFEVILDGGTTKEKLLNDYQEKVIPDIISGKITPNTMNY